jgi:hypothetical protein
MQATKVADLPGPNSRMPLHVAVLKSLPGIVQILVSVLSKLIESLWCMPGQR